MAKAVRKRWRAGRKRKLEDRKPSGRLRQVKQPKDQGSEAAQARRAWFAGSGDPSKTTYPLGVLWTNGVISDDEHRAGCYYAWLHGFVYGRVSIAAAKYEAQSRSFQALEESGEIEKVRKKLERRLNGASASMSAGERSAVADVAIFESVPAWMTPAPPTPSDVAQARTFQRGIAALVRAFASL